MKLILVRHGEVHNNVQEINGYDYDTKDSQLTDKGRKQAEKAGERLKRIKIDKAYISPLQRAQDTAEAILKHHQDTERIIAQEAKERMVGKLGGSKYGTITNTAIASGIPFRKFRPEGGESYEDVSKRAADFIKKIEKTDKGKSVLIVSHGTWIKELVMSLLRAPGEHHEKYNHPNTAITILNIKDDGNHEAEIIADTKHLKETQ